MPKFLVEVKYSLDGAKGLMAEGGSSRVAASKTLIESLGGRLETFYFAFGEADGYIIADMPDNISAAGRRTGCESFRWGHVSDGGAPHARRDRCSLTEAGELPRPGRLTRAAAGELLRVRASG